MKGFRAGFLFSIVLCWLVNPQMPGWAQEQNKPVLKLTLQELIQDVIGSNPAIGEARLQYLISQSEASAEWGAFEPELVARYDHSKLRKENTTLQALARGGQPLFREENGEYSLGVEGRFISNGTYQIGCSMNKMENTLAADTEYESFFGVSGEQPLLKGLTHGAPMAGVRAATQDRFIAFHRYRKQLMQTISTAESSYWNLAFAQEQYRMNTDSVEIAEKIVEDNRERVRAGRMTDLDLMEAEAELAIRVTQQADAEQNLLDSMTRVKLLLSDPEIGEDQQLIATDPLEFTYDGLRSREEERRFSVKWALRAQPDYMIRWEELRREMIVLGYQMDQRLPELNLKASYGFNGLGDSPQEAYRRILSRDYPSWSVGVEMRFALLSGIREKRTLEAARLKRKLAEMQLKATDYEIINSIETLVQRVSTLKERIESARKVVEFRERLLKVELSRLEAGKSTTRLIYQAEEELTRAREWELESIVRYREALMQLAYFRGSVLLDKGLESMEGDQVVLSDQLLFRQD
jgi:outer membrane protein TolC